MLEVDRRGGLPGELASDAERGLADGEVLLPGTRSARIPSHSSHVDQSHRRAQRVKLLLIVMETTV